VIAALFLLPRLVGAGMAVAAAVTEVRALVNDARALAAARREALEAARAFAPAPAPDYDNVEHHTNGFPAVARALVDLEPDPAAAAVGDEDDDESVRFGRGDE
jgi:hypothetical protein